MNRALAGVFAALALSIGSFGCSPQVDDDVHVASPAKAILIPGLAMDAAENSSESTSGGPQSGRADDLVLELTNHAVYSCKSPTFSPGGPGGCAPDPEGDWQLSIELRPSQLESGSLDLAAPARHAEVDFELPYDGFDDCSGGDVQLRHGTLVIDDVGAKGVLFHLVGTNGSYVGSGSGGGGVNVASDGRYEALRCD